MFISTLLALVLRQAAAAYVQKWKHPDTLHTATTLYCPHHTQCCASAPIRCSCTFGGTCRKSVTVSASLPLRDASFYSVHPRCHRELPPRYLQAPDCSSSRARPMDHYKEGKKSPICRCFGGPHRWRPYKTRVAREAVPPPVTPAPRGPPKPFFHSRSFLSLSLG
ncbi:hypothetical protein BD413DRAFT_92369 [Trametes elegans]|nr:hypothetical protein BD413DRAFT_92369 [Trametes elegans]